MVSSKLAPGLALVALAAARDIPAGVKTVYDAIVNKGECANVLADGFLSIDDGDDSYGYCGDLMDKYGIMYIQGTGGNLANMDIDCDGIPDGPGDDGRCGSSDDTQYETAFKEDVQEFGIEDLNSFVHDYVVFGNYGEADGYITYDPEQDGVRPLSVMAVVCGDKLVYGIWGDTNGDDGNPLVGEASISLASRCFGKEDINGDSGYDGQDVLYIAFTGDDAAPGAELDWEAETSDAFQESLQAYGDALIARFENGASKL